MLTANTLFGTRTNEWPKASRVGVKIGEALMSGVETRESPLQ